MADAKTDEIAEEGPVICPHYSEFDTKYTKIKQLGRAGQYGVTHLCRHIDKTTKLEIPDEVAVKVMEKSRFRSHGPRLYQKWIGFQKSEITALLIARHENIVRLYDVLEDPERVYLVMEYLPGGELLQWIVKQGTVTEFSVANIIHQVLMGLDYMHGRNILHLDLKPENIMLVNADDDMPRIKLIDFGFATILPRLEKMGGRRGTPYYMAPEMLSGEYERAVDVWATGVITFTMLFGYLPFYDDHGKNVKVIFRQIQLGFEPSVRRGCGAWFPKNIPISQEGMDFIAGMLRSNVGERITVEEALASPWLRGNAPKDILPEVAMRGLEQFTTAFHRNRKMTMLLSDPEIVHLDAEHTVRTDSILEEYGEEGKMIEKEAFINRMGSKMTSMRHLAVAELFEEIDADKDGYISAETVSRIEAFHQLIAVDDRMLNLFDQLDLDHDGRLSADEIQQAIDKISPHAQQLVHVRSVFAQTDANNDGFIDRDEFLSAIHPNFMPEIQGTTISVTRAQAFSFPSIRQRSQLYYDLLRQLEEDKNGGAGSLAAASKQLTVPQALRLPTPLAAVSEETDEIEMTPAQKRRREVEMKLMKEQLDKQKSKKQNTHPGVGDNAVTIRLNVESNSPQSSMHPSESASTSMSSADDANMKVGLAAKDEAGESIRVPKGPHMVPSASDSNALLTDSQERTDAEGNDGGCCLVM